MSGQPPERGGSPTPHGAAGQDRWARVHEEAARLGPGWLGLLWWVDARAAAFGLPPLSPWWRFTLTAFHFSLRRWFLARVGRRGGKSSSVSRALVALGVLQPRSIPKGDTGIVPLVSTEQREATKRLRNLRAVLEAIGMRHEQSPDVGAFSYAESRQGGGTIGFLDTAKQPCQFEVQPATVSASSGFTGISALLDEQTKWRKADSAANPDVEVQDAIRPTLATQPEARGFRVSSAYLAKGSHFDDVNTGGDDLHFVATIGEPFLDLARAGFLRVAEWEEQKGRENPGEAPAREANAIKLRAYAAALTADSPNVPSWVANPNLDPVETRIEAGPGPHKLAVWFREYGSVSSEPGAADPCFDPLTLDAAEQRPRPAGEPSAVFAAIDTGAKRNPAALAIVGRWDVPSGYVFAPMLLRSWRPSPGRPLDLRLDVLPAMARATVAAGCAEWASDGFASDQIDIVAAEHGIRVTYVATSEAHRDVYAPVSDGLGRGEVSLTGCDGIPEAVAQMRRVSSETELGAAGARVRIVVPEDAGGEHGDLGVALVRALAAAGCGRIEEDDGELLGAGGRYVGVRAA